MSRATTSTDRSTEYDFEAYRRELTGYCYRMLGSGFEAEDAVQETMIRAWRKVDQLQGQSALRSWMYSIATNVCLDMLRGPQRRARPMDLGPSSTAATPIFPTARPENTFVEPIADAKVLPHGGDPAELAASRETIRLAFIAALQNLPPKQRAVLILREVLCWHADEVAELLDTSVASVNSALQRARATMAADAGGHKPSTAVDPSQQALLARYIDAFERYDMTKLVELLHDDAIMSMPPFTMWLEGPDQITEFFVGQGAACEGSKLVATTANGCPAFGSYKPDPNGGYAPWAIQVIEMADDRITGHHNFLDTKLFEAFGLPAHLD
ncbi:MAG: sigma-70 family RNA polymerase sigma factor [Ilumatobacteraceae bacterium]